MEHAPAKKFPLNAQDYELFEEIGNGVSATVYKALCVPLNELVAIKVLDLEKCNSDLDGIRREVHTMSLIDHPNVLRAYCSFPAGHSLWVVMPYMAGGSCLHIMKSTYPDGFEEPVIATLLREVLKALVYLHSHGHIHRDVKAGNILVDSNGSVKLADFGVSACMFETGDRQRCRNTFVGTPCWMAPEVMQQLQGYDFKADIWSFGITALELAHGHAPFSKYPPMKVLLMTLQNAPPGLDYERDKRFSNSFRELVGTCLEKDPKKRPSSEKLMKHPFFRRGRSAEYLARTILDGLAPLNERFSKLKEKEAALLVQKKALYEDKEQLSQQQYIRGISAWNFNLEDLKSQAALIQDFDEAPNVEEYIKQEKHEEFPEWRITTDSVDLSNVSSNEEDDLNDLKSSLASFPSKPLDALKDCFDVGDNNINESVMRSWEDPQLDSEYRVKFSSEGECQVRSRRQVISDHKKLLSSSSVPDSFASLKKITSDRDQLQSKCLPERMHSGHLGDCQNRDANNYSSGDGIQDGLVVQRKGRFKVTSGELSPKALINSSFSTMSGLSTSPVIPTNPNMDVTMLFSSARRMLKWNEISRDELDQFLTTLEQLYGQHEESADAGNTELMPVSAPTEREKQLQNEVASREQIIRLLEEELQIQKLKVSQLQLELDMSSKNHQEDRTEKNE